MIELLLPELRKRGLFWDDYLVKGGTYRENISGQIGQKHPADDHPAARYQWRAGVEEKDHAIPPEPKQENKPSLKRPLESPQEVLGGERRKSARVNS